MNQNPPQGQKKILLLAKSGGFISQFELQNVRMLRDMGYEIFYAADFEHPVYDLREKELEELGVRRIQIDISGSPLAIFRHLGELKKLQKEILFITKNTAEV